MTWISGCVWKCGVYHPCMAVLVIGSLMANHQTIPYLFTCQVKVSRFKQRTRPGRYRCRYALNSQTHTHTHSWKTIFWLPLVSNHGASPEVLGIEIPNQRQSVDNQGQIMWSNWGKSKESVGVSFWLNHVKKSSLLLTRNHCSVDIDLLKLNKDRSIKSSFMMGNPSNHMENPRPANHRITTGPWRNLGRIDTWKTVCRMESWLVHRSCLSFLSILWHLEMQSQKGLSSPDWVTDHKI